MSGRRQHGTPGYSVAEPLSPSAHLCCSLSTQPSRSPVLPGLVEDPAVWVAEMTVLSPPTSRRKSVSSKKPCSCSIPPLEVSMMSSPYAGLKPDQKAGGRERSAEDKGTTVIFSFTPAGLPTVRWARGQGIPGSSDHACHRVRQRIDPRVQIRGHLSHEDQPSLRSALRYVRSSHPVTPRLGKRVSYSIYSTGHDTLMTLQRSILDLVLTS